jgi:IS1 family transposase
LLHPDEVEVVIRIAEEAEVDEMWSFVKRKKTPRWLWHAIDHRSGKVLAYVFGRRQDEVFLKLKALLEPSLNLSEFVVGCSWHTCARVGRAKAPLFSRV